MSQYAVMPLEDYTNACDAIREKTGGTGAITSGNMATQISSIEIGSSGITPTGTINIAANGTYDVTSKATAVVNVTASGGDPYAVMNSIINGTITTFETNGNFSHSNQNFGTIFNNCPNLTRWGVPYNTRDLGTYLFRGCSNLVYIDLGSPPRTQQTLFYGKHLPNTSIVVRAVTPPTLPGAFSGTSYDSTTVFYVPKASINLYKAATNWSTYADNFKAIEDYPEITGGALPV